MKPLKSLMSAAVLLIGIYMVWKFNANMPPLLSGIAFILIGIQGMCKKK